MTATATDIDFDSLAAIRDAYVRGVLPGMLDLTTAGRACGMGRATVYKAAAEGALPFRVIRAGRHQMKVPSADVLRVLGIDVDAPPRAEVPDDAHETAERRRHDAEETGRGPSPPTPAGVA